MYSQNLFYSTSLTKAVKSIFLICLCSLNLNTFCQPPTWNISELKNVDSVLSKIGEQHKNQLKKYDDDSTLVNLYQARFNYIDFQVREGLILYEKGLYDYLNNLKSLIIKENGLESDEIMLFVSYSPIPNAFSLGDGVIVFNLGLLHRLKNEAQVTFIMSHEIAHFISDHSNSTAIKNKNQIESQLSKERLDSLLNQKYNRRELVSNFLKEVFYEQMSYSRTQEIEADSIGYQYFKNTSYPKDEAYKTLNFLDSIDNYSLSNPIDFQKIFSTDSLAFNEQWLHEESYMFGGAHLNNSLNSDSARSHPHAHVRADIIRGQINEDSILNNKPVQYSTDSSYFPFLQEKLRIEFLTSWIKYQNYSKALFFALKHLTVDSENKELILKTSEILDSIYLRYSENELSNYIDRPSSSQDDDYVKVTEFIDNISLSELGLLIFNFHLKNKSLFEDNDVYMERLDKYAKINNK